MPGDEDKGTTGIAKLKIKNPDGQVAEWIDTTQLDDPAVKKPDGNSA
jgi:hypothetical protein